MKKLFAVFMIIFLIPASQSLHIDKIEGYTAKEEIKNFETTDRTHFVVTDKDFFRSYLQVFSPEKNWSRNPTGSFLKDIAVSGKTAAAATRFNSPEFFIFDSNGSFIHRGETGFFYDPRRVTALSSENRTFFSITTHHDTVDSFPHRMKIYTKRGEKFSTITNHFYYPMAGEKLRDLDNDSEKEMAVTYRSKDAGSMVRQLELDGDSDWRIIPGQRKYSSELLPGKGILVYWRKGMRLKDPGGETEWSVKTETRDLNPLALEEFIIYSNSTHLVYRDYRGEKFRTSKIERKVEGLTKVPGKNILVGKQGDNLSFFSLKGRKLGSKRFKDLKPVFRFGNYTGKPDLVFATGRKLNVYSLEENQEFKEVETPEHYGFVGENNQMLKLVALNKTVFLGDDPELFEDETYRKLVKVGKNLEEKSITDPNRQLNVSKPRYFVKDRKKAVYVSALAARDNATISFDREKADRDFSNHTVEELQNLFIEEFRPDHVAVADLESSEGLLTAYMAVKQGIMPIHFGKSYSYPEKEGIDVRKQNRYNSVIRLEEKINKTFDRIGENSETVWNGRYISIIGGPRKIYSDPADSIFSSGPDGSWFTSDLGYGDLNKDGYLEAGVGRYPENLSVASMIYHRSLKRKDGKDALVASSYMTESWPHTLATGGGGLKYGSAMENLFELQGYDTTHIVEQRSHPEKLLGELVPGSIEKFMDHNRFVSDKLRKYATATKAIMFKKAVIILQSFHYTEEIIKTFYEFKWETAGFDYDRGVERLQEMDIPKGTRLNEIVQKSAVKALYAAFWPERHPELNSASISSGMKDRDIIYYMGKGTSDKWKLPSEHRPEHYGQIYPGYRIPEIDRSIVWDSSDQAGSLNAKMRKKFLEKGASSHIGFSGYNYPGFTSEIGNLYFREGKTLGNSLKNSLNSFRSVKDIYTSANTLQDSKVKEKTMDSIVLYGNPEMRKDPIGNSRFKLDRDCQKTECTLTAVLTPDYQVEELGGQTFVDFNTTARLKQPGRPITPLYSLELDISEDSIRKIEADKYFKNRSNISLPEASRLRNRSEQDAGEQKLPFPENSSGYITRENSLKFLQAGTKSFGNTTSILEKAVITVKYEPKAVVGLKRENQSLKAEINSKEDFKGTLFYRLNQDKEKLEVNISEGEKQVTLGSLPQGKVKTRAYLYNESLISRSSKTFYRGKEVEISTEIPEKIVQEKPESVFIHVKNPNSFPVKKTVSVRTGKNLRLGFLEKKAKTICIDPNETEKLKFAVVGSKPGNSTLAVENKSKLVSIEGKSPEKRLNSIKKLSKIFGSRTRRLSKEKQDSSYKIKLESIKGRLKIEKTPEHEIKKIKTENFSAKIIETESYIKKIVSDKNSSYKFFTDSGINKNSGKMDRREFNRYIDILEREASKFSLK